MNKDRILRRIVPSVPVLARTPLGAALDFLDNLIKMRHPEWKDLPPASLRMRIGVGNRVLRNHDVFVQLGKSLVKELDQKRFLTPTSRVLELGCGCGRNAIAFLNYLNGGSYIGQDVDKEMIEWCRRHLLDKRLSFHHANIYSKVYNPAGISADGYSFPARDGSIDLVVSVSVFSHLLFADSSRYIEEGSRVLSKGGFFHMTLFMMDFIREKLGGRYTFRHRAKDCYVENLAYPEAAVAYDLSVVRNLLDRNSLKIFEIYNKDLHQQTLIAQKV